MQYKHFGVMIDCSRNGVMTVAAVKRMIDALQKMGYNALELYTEDTFEVGDEPYFGYLRGRYTGAELREIDAYAAAHGIELIPCIQTLAHFTNPVKLPRFWEIVDVNDILLIDEEETYRFIERLFKTLAENFTSRNVNIGMDEAHMVGLGKFLDRHGYQNRFEILNRHLGRVTEIAKKYGFTPHMWSDMFFRLAAGGDYYAKGVHIPESVRRQVPESVELAYWDYYHTDETVYDEMIAAHKEFGRGIWFAGGAWEWHGFSPNVRFTEQTMRPAMQSVMKNGIDNVLITMWGDNGSECPRFSLLQSLYAIRRYADGCFDGKTIAADFEKLFGVSAADFDTLALPDVIPGETTGAPNPCKALLYNDPFLGILDVAAASVPEIPYAAYAAQLAAAKARAGEYAYMFDSQEKLCRVLEKKAYLGIRTRAAYKRGDKAELKRVAADYDETVKRVQAFYEAFRTMWHTEYKPFGFEVQDARLGGLMLRLKNCRARLDAYIAGKIDRIEELEETLLPREADNPKAGLEWNDYRHTVTTSEL